MTRSLLRFALAAGVLAALAMARPALAQSVSFQVSANVLRICTISAVDIAFVGYDPVTAHATTPADAEGTVRIQCTRGTAWNVDLGPGSNSSGGRRMQLGATGEYLAYELYSDASRSAVWNAAGASGTAANRSPLDLTVYARVPAGQDPVEGFFTDSVLATVNF